MGRRITEEEYLRLETPTRVAGLFNSRTPLRTSTRKARLYLCSCCRRVWDWLGTDANQAAVEAAERAAEGHIRIKDLHPFYDATTYVIVPLKDAPRARANPAGAAAWPFPWPNAGSSFAAACLAGYHRAGTDVVRQKPLISAELMAQCAVIRDLLGNPFRPALVAPGWLTPLVVQLAEAAYEERLMPSGELEVHRLAVLADALEEVGCDNLDILNHLRGPGPHVRGCWIIDALTGRS